MQLFETINRRQFVIGSAALLAGILGYAITRSPNDVYFLAVLSLPLHGPGALLGLPPMFRDNFPTFAHAFAFSTITGSVCARGPVKYAMAAVSWLIIEALCELGQGPGRWLVDLLFGHHTDGPLITMTRTYFEAGTFDRGDIIAACIGSVLSFGTLMVTGNRQKGAL